MDEADDTPITPEPKQHKMVFEFQTPQRVSVARGWIRRIGIRTPQIVSLSAVWQRVRGVVADAVEQVRDVVVVDVVERVRLPPGTAPTFDRDKIVGVAEELISRGGVYTSRDEFRRYVRDECRYRRCPPIKTPGRTRMLEILGPIWDARQTRQK
jgi:hypothetical protein